MSATRTIADASKPGIRSAGRQRSPRRIVRPVPTLIVQALIACGALSAPGYAQQPTIAATTLPSGGVIAGGAAAGGISTAGNRMQVRQNVDRMVVDWQGFSIGRDARVDFLQPNLRAAALNRVAAGAGASVIDGTLTANGQFYLLNPNGVYFGRGAQVDVGSLLASSLRMSDQDFREGRITLTGGAAGGSVENHGSIRAAPGGHVVLLAPKVTNVGTITAPQGSIALGAGGAATVTLRDQQFVEFKVDPAAVSTIVENAGTLRADGGQVLMTARATGDLVSAVVNNRGVIEARSIREFDGVIRLEADGVVANAGRIDAAGVDGAARGGSIQIRAGRADLGGEIDASGPAGGTVDLRAVQRMDLANASVSANGQVHGGDVTVTGEVVTLRASQVEASAEGHGGRIRVGGDFHGETADFQNARFVSVDSATTLDASARDQGRGGKLVIWADDRTVFLGNASAGGGKTTGDGGEVEISGRNRLYFDGSVHASARNGKPGTVLFDPADLVVDTDQAASGSNLPVSGTIFADTDPGATYVIKASSVSNVLNGGTTVRLQANNDLTINAPVTSASSASLFLEAGRSVLVNANITVGGAVQIDVNQEVSGSRFEAPLRQAGSATFLMAPGTSIGAGRDVRIFLHGGGRDGSFADFDSITLYDVRGTYVEASYMGRFFAGSGFGDLFVNGNVQASTAYLESLGTGRVEVGFNGSIEAGFATLRTGSGGLINRAPTARQLDVTFRATKEYDGGTDVPSAALVQQSGLVNGDGVRWMGGRTSERSAGNNKPVREVKLLIEGANVGTYNLRVNATADIARKTVSLDPSAYNKTYDGSTTKLISNLGSLVVGRVDADSVFPDGIVNFTDANVGVGKAITTTGLTLYGFDAGNYTLAPPRTSADITARPVPSLAGRRQYDGTRVFGASAFGASGSIQTGIGNETLMLTGSGMVGNAHVATGVQALDLGTLALNDGSGLASNYTLLGLPGAGHTGTVTPAALTANASITAAAKTYDGTLAATGSTVSGGVSGLVGTDTMTLGTSGVSLRFSDAHVATPGKTIGATGNVVLGALTSTGSGDRSGSGVANRVVSFASDYVLPVQPVIASVAGTITPAVLTANASITAAPKTFDGTVAATGSTLSGGFSGLVGTDTMTLGTSGVSLRFSDAHVATSGKTIGATGNVVLGALTSTGSGDQSGSSAANRVVSAVSDYVLPVQPVIASVAGTITPAVLTASAGITAAPKTYDGTLAATGSTLSGGVSGLVGADAMTLDTSGVSLSFSDAHVVTPGKTIGATGNVVLGALTSTGSGDRSGSSAANRVVSAASDYVLPVQPVINAVAGTITPAALAASASITAAPKTYDGTLAATGSTLSGGVSGLVGTDTMTLDTSGVSLSFSDAHVATPGKTIAATGNVMLGALTSTGSGDRSGSGAANRVVSVASDYVLPVQPAIASVAGTIMARPVTLAGSRQYDGTAVATGSILAATNAVAGDTVMFTGNATLASRNAGVEPITSFAGLVPSNANYTVAGASGTVNVTRAPLTGTVTANNKVYDGTATATLSTSGLSGLIGSDAVTVTAAAANFADPNAGAGKVVTATGLALGGADAGNYALPATTASTTADILARPVTVSGSRQYDGTALATGAILTTTNVVAGDTVAFTGSATLASRNAGVESITSFAGLVPSNANYTVTGASGTVNVTRAPLTVSTGNVVRTYDGTTAAPGAAATVSGGTLFGADVLSGGSFAFTDRNAGSNKTVTVSGVAVNDGNGGNNYALTLANNTTSRIDALPVTVSGSRQYDGTAVATGSILTATNAVAGDTVMFTGNATLASRNAGVEPVTSFAGLVPSNANYTVAGASGTVEITRAPLTISAVPNTRTYDRTTNAAAVPTVTGLQPGDTVTGVSEVYADRNVGNGKTLNVASFTVNDGHAGNNYVVTTVSSNSGVIAPAALGAAIAAVDRVYDGTTTATLSAVAPTGVFSGDTVTLTAGAASFSDRNAGEGKSVTATGLALGGPDAGNYVLVGSSAATSASILPRPLTVSPAGAVAKIYGDPDPAIGFNVVGGLIPGDVVVGSLSRDPGENAGVYAIRSSPIAPNPNYVLSVLPGTFAFTIQPAPLDVRAEDKSRSIGFDNPPLTATITGFRLADTSAALAGTLSLTTPATAGSSAGAYPISASGLSSRNYDIQYVNGTLSVLAAPVSIAGLIPNLLGASGLGATGGVNLFNADASQLAALLSNSGSNQPASAIQATVGSSGAASGQSTTPASGGIAGAVDTNSPGGTGVAGGLFEGLGAAGVGGFGGRGGIGTGTGGGIGSGRGTGIGSSTTASFKVADESQGGLAGGRGEGGTPVQQGRVSATSAAAIAATIVPSFQRIEVASEGVRLPAGVDPVACRIDAGRPVSLADTLDSLLGTCSK